LRERCCILRIRALIRRCDTDMLYPEQRAFLRLNVDFFYEVTAVTGNQPLREISERLYFQVARVVAKMMTQLGLVEELTAFHREVMEVLAVAEIGDLESIGHIRRAHISMSVQRIMLQRTGGLTKLASLAASVCGRVQPSDQNCDPVLPAEYTVEIGTSPGIVGDG
jgi:DNA-binding GntR family transcriptional regulator